MKKIIILTGVAVFFCCLYVSVLTAQTSAQSTIRTSYTQEVIETETLPPSFGGKIWNGIKTGASWTWNGIKKGAFYMKEGCVSVLEKTGMKNKPNEGETHDRILQDANRSLVESQTKREIRQDKYDGYVIPQ